MASTKTMKWSLSCLIFISMVMLKECIHGSREGQLSSYDRGVFRDESGMALSQMLVSNESGTYFVYVGGVSTLYQLDMDLTPLRQENTSPDPCEDPCLYETKILEIAPSPVGKLIQCGGPEGKCELRNWMDISREFGYAVQGVVNNGLSVGIVAFRTMPADPSLSMFMYVATSIEDPGNNENPPISLRELQRTNPSFVFDYNFAIPSSSVSSTVTYIQGVSWNNYTFFIVHSGSMQSAIQSKLGRMCSDNNERELDAYSEILLSCQSYNTLQAVHIDSNDVLYSVFTNGTHSALCSYTMSDIQEKFVDTTCGCVINSGVCNGQGTEISYLAAESFCRPGSNSQETRESIEKNYQCGNAANPVRFKYAQTSSAYALIGQLLGEGLPGENSSIATLNKENETVALVAISSTSTATLSKIHVKPDGTGRLYETVDLEVDSEVLTDVYINQESEELFILTNNEILKLAVVNCSQYKSCAECIGPTTGDGDPFCGWCTLEKKCSRSSECNNPDSDSLIWLQYDQDCIAINDLDPPSQKLDSAPLTVTFNVSQLPYHESDSEYTCRFDEVASSTSRTGNSFSCTTPATDDRPTLPDGQDYVTMSLGIFARTTNNIIVEAEFPFFMCSAISSCSECVSSAWGCDWCVYESRCTLNGVSACISADEVVVENKDSCPHLDNLSTEILIPVGLSRTIYLTGENLPTMNEVSYRCILSNMTDGSLLRRVDVDYFNSTSVQCQATVYDLASPSTLEEQVTIHVEYTSDVSSEYQLLDSEDNSVTLFQCSANGMSCRSCVTTTVRAQLGCGWCVESSSGACQVEAADELCNGNFFQRGSSEECPAPSISGIFPSAGPLEGNTTLTISGTNLAAEFNETINITVAGIECSLNDFEPGLSVDCITGSSGNETRSGTVIVVFAFNETAESDDSFIYRNPVVYDFAPKTGIVSGGTEINITGQYLDTGRNIQVSVGDAECIMTEERPSSELIQCITSPLPDTSEMDNVSVIVTFDGTRKEVPGKYRFISDPTIEDYNPKETIMAGGITVTVTGSGFSIVQSAIMELTIGDEVIMEECSVNSGEVISCLTPDLQNYTSSTSVSSRKRRQATDVETAFVLDGFRYNPSESLTLYPDPVYDVFEEYVIRSPGGTEMFTGVNLNVPTEKTEDFVTVCFGKGECDVTEVTATQLSCLSPTEVPEGGVCKGDNADLPDVLNIVVFHGENLRQYLGTARYSTDSNLPQIVGGAVGGVVFLCIIVFLVFVCVGHRNYKAQIRHTEMEMENLMQHSRRQVMEGFFIDQEMTDTEEQLRGLGMPFVSNHDYMKSMLFFGLDVKPATTDPEIPSDMEQRAMLEFSKLLSNKNFLITIIHTLDNCKQITTVKKANIASLLTVVLVMERKFRYFTDVLVTLMSETISDAAERQRIKQLFKRTLTLEDKMLNNWIALAMFQSIKGYVGQPLYMLYQAIKIQCEKGPVDAVTGKSFFSLNFDNLLTEEVDFEELTLNVDSEIGQEPVKVLNVDTITQVKEKILDAMYRKKHTKYQRSAREVDLVIRSGQAGELVISDYDTSTQPSMGWCPINTLLHYGIQSGTQVALTDKKDMPNAMPVPMNDGANNLFNDTTRKSVRVTGHHEYNSHDLEKGPKDLKYYHLVQTEDSEEQVEEQQEGFCGRMQRVLCFKGTQGKRKIREIYLQRLVSVKQSINNFVAQALDAMFTIREDSYVNNVNNIPFALRFLFNFFDEEASRYDDNVTAATWKNNILPLRFWSTILAHPSFIFNMRQSRTADSSVVVLNQMLDNACKGVVPTLKMNASPSRLLFNKELPDYISLLSSYYHNIQQTPTLEETELREECTRIDEEFSGLFSRLTTLKQLYECIRPHETLLVKALQEDDECHAAHFADSLQRVGNTLDQPAD